MPGLYCRLLCTTLAVRGLHLYQMSTTETSVKQFIGDKMWKSALLILLVDHIPTLLQPQPLQLSHTNVKSFVRGDLEQPFKIAHMMEYSNSSGTTFSMSYKLKLQTRWQLYPQQLVASHWYQERRSTCSWYWMWPMPYTVEIKRCLLYIIR